MEGDRNLKLTRAEIATAFADAKVADQFPPVLDIEQAARLLRVPVGTLRDWRSRGVLDKCSRRVGRHVRFWRDRLIETAFNVGI